MCPSPTCILPSGYTSTSQEILGKIHGCSEASVTSCLSSATKVWSHLHLRPQVLCSQTAPHACPTCILPVNKHTLTQANTHQKPRPLQQTPNFLGTPAFGDTWGCGLREAIARSYFAPTQVGPRFSGQKVFSLPERAQTPSTGPCALS